MNLTDYRELFSYNDWANDQLCKMLYAAFGAETNLRNHAEPLHFAIQETTVHIIAGLAIWRTRWQGFSPKAMLSPEDYPTPESQRMAFGAERARFWNYFETLNEELLESKIAFKNIAGEASQMPLCVMLSHVVNHSTYHRGQITARLIDLGLDEHILSTDLTTFYLELKKRHHNG